MNDTLAGTAPDLIDTLVGLTPGDALYATRHARAKVVNATQASQELFFAPEGDSIPLEDRLMVALHASLLSRSEPLAAHYRQALDEAQPDAQALAAIERGDISGLPDTRLKAMLAFTETLIMRPIEGDRNALQRLQAAGIATPDIVTLAQLIAYLSYQIRVVAGLKAMKALEQA